MYNSFTYYFNRLILMQKLNKDGFNNGLTSFSLEDVEFV